MNDEEGDTSRYTLVMPCAWCDTRTIFSTNNQQHAIEVLTHGRLCAECYASQEWDREKAEREPIQRGASEHEDM